MTLPVADVVDDILAALVAQNDVLLCAPTGAGKSTWLPLQLLKSPALATWRIIMLEPRRIAAKSVASYLAKQLNEPVGQTVGYRIRQEHRVSAQTRLEVVTEGVLTRMLQADPELSDYQLVIFDECHERSIHADLAFALCLDMRAALRDDLQLMLMSATADISAYQSQLPDAVHIASEGRAYPVDIYYRPQTKQGWLVGMVAVIAEAINWTEQGSALVFLPGAGEIQRLQAELTQDSRFAAFEILPLHGGLPFAQQTQALTPPTTRRITLATNVAETSLTLPDITIVIDGGRERMVKFQLKNSIDQLITRRVSKASARQRAGRAGRLSAGCCYRLWSENEQYGLSEQLQPEIERSDVSALVMECAAWGVTEPEQLNWLTPPPHTAWQQAKQLLVALGILSETGQLREAGHKAQALGCSPRLGAMLLAVQSHSPDVVAVNCLVAALLGEADPLKQRDNIDLQARIDWLQHSPHHPIAKRINEQARRWYRVLSSEPWPHTIAAVSAYWLSYAYPDRIGIKRKGEQGRYHLSSGFGVEMGEDAAPLGEHIVVAQLSAGEQHASGMIRLACAFSQSEWQALVNERAETHTAQCWDASQQRVIAEQQQRLAALVLKRTRSGTPSGDSAESLLMQQIIDAKLAPLPWDDASRSIWQRAMQWSQCTKGESALNEQILLQDADMWLKPYLAGLVAFSELSSLDLCSMLRYYMGAEACQWIDQHLPRYFQTPLQRQVAIRYTDDGQAIVSVPMQEMYGFDQLITLGAGRMTLAFELLSPASRPIQLTTDLPRFWRGSYSAVQKEMKGRYPKHFWPDHPQDAEPTRLTKRHLAH